MKTFIGQVILIVLLVVVGLALWSAGNAEERLASAEHTLVTLRYARAAAELDAAASPSRTERLLAGFFGTPTAAATSGRQASYWLGEYEQFIKTDDPALKMLAADAAYRAMRAQGGTWQMVTARLDEIAKRYADVLRDNPENEDAAYNYEFVLRLRTAVATARQIIPPLDLASTGLTIHGRSGGPPEGSDTKKFKMIVPMRPDERMEAEQAGRGATKPRKG